jgi:hypothetical protein
MGCCQSSHAAVHSSSAPAAASRTPFAGGSASAAYETTDLHAGAAAGTASASAAAGGGGGGDGSGGGGGGGVASGTFPSLAKLGSAPDLLVAAALRHTRHTATIYGESLSFGGAGATAAVAVVPKPAAVRELLFAALRGSIFFGDFGYDELTALVDGMEARAVAAGTTVVRQGDAGKCTARSGACARG